MIDPRLKRAPDESERQYLWRIGVLKDNGCIDMTWDELSDYINVECRDNEEEYRCESAYRKRYAEGKGWYAEVFSKCKGDQEYLDQLRNEQTTLDKARIKLRDERAEINRLLREQARRESFIELVRRAIAEHVEPLAPIPLPAITSDCDLIVHLTDLHTGIEIDNWVNQYNADILRKRLEYYLGKIRNIQRTHQAQRCYVVLGGDLISGHIHPNLRLQNNENTISQIKIASSFIGHFIAELAKSFSTIEVHNTPGNHSRLTPQKEQHLQGEELDLLVSYYLELMFKDYCNVSIRSNEVDSDIASFVVRGHTWFAVHGDKDTASNVVQNLTLLTGAKPAGVIMGHRHRNGLSTVHGVKVVESGCVSGTDTFAFGKRLTNEPEQCVIVTDEENPVLCLYDVQLS